jgi:hypothetical protein
MSRIILLSISIALATLTACTNVESTAEKVFTNANDAVKPENNSIWWEGQDAENKKK